MSSMFRGPPGQPMSIMPGNAARPQFGNQPGQVPQFGGNTFLGAMGRMNPQTPQQAPTAYANGPDAFLSRMGQMQGGMPGGPAVSPMRGPGGAVIPAPGMMPGGPAVSPMRQPGGMMPGQPMDPRMAIASALLGRK